MSRQTTNESAKLSAMEKIAAINAVEGFDPAPLAMEIGNMNEGGVRQRLPVMAQMAWFRLKYPEGRLAVSVKPGKDPNGNVYFIAEARVYAHYTNPTECFLAEGSASRGYLPDKPTVSPREWAQTAAIGMALRNAGFGLQFAVAGESYEDNTLNEFAGFSVNETVTAPQPDTTGAPTQSITAALPEAQQPAAEQTAAQRQTVPPVPPPAEPELSPLERAMQTPCPIGRYKDKTLGDVLHIDPSAVAYVAKNPQKYNAELIAAATLICEHAMQKASA